METIMKVTNLAKYFKDIKAVDHISFEVMQGELFALLGVNGAGKSTTINMLSTLTKPSEGLFINTSSAWGGLATIVSTLVGFLGGIYIPVGGLPEKIGQFLAYLPILHGTALIRKVVCEEAIHETFYGLPTECIRIFNEKMGIVIKMNESIVTQRFQLFFLAACGIIAVSMIALRLRVLKVNDR
ncbi:MAG: ATP-binding cassette domain-containing protein [Clostridia bacterium]|nr:ATP-binding cassette domain-containing protein [Clostridia bacterium]